MCLLKQGEKAFLIAPDGKVMGEAEHFGVWLPDSRHVVAVRQTRAERWEQFSALLEPGERARIEFWAANEAAWFKKWGPQIQSPKPEEWTEEQKASRAEFTRIYGRDAGGGAVPGMAPLDVWFYLREKQPEDFSTIAAIFKVDQEAIEAMTPRISQLVIADVLPGGARAAAMSLVRTAGEIARVTPSPDGRYVAYAVGGRLFAVPARDGSRSVLVDEGTGAVAWSLDGKRLVYLKTSGADRLGKAEDIQPGTLAQRAVRDDRGEMMDKAGDVEELAAVWFCSEFSVAVLPDGRVAFTGPAIHLPAPADGPAEFSLFALKPGEAPTLECLLPKGAGVPNAIWLPSLSPDGRHVLMAAHDGSFLGLLSLESKSVQILYAEAKWTGRDSKTLGRVGAPPMAGWRTADEFTYVAPPGRDGAGPRRAEMIIRKVGGPPRVISTSWSDEMADDILPRPVP